MRICAPVLRLIEPGNELFGLTNGAHAATAFHRIRVLKGKALLVGRRGQRHEVSGARRLAGQGPQ
jgi:hypothetical protein